MVRTQIQLTAEQATALRELASRSGRSMADLIRGSVDQMLQAQRRSSRGEKIERALRVVGRFRSEQPTAVSEEHDRYLSEAFGS